MTYLGIDVGGTDVKVGVCDVAGKFAHKAKHSTADWRRAGFIDPLCACIAELLSTFPSLGGIALGIPAPINKELTVPRETKAIPELSDFPLVATLRDRFPHVPFVVENDTHLAALGEARFNASLTGDFIFITLGTGIGAAAIIDDELFYGSNGASMQLGHMVDAEGRTLEQKTGVKGIEALMQGRFESFAHLIAQGEAGQPAALTVFRTVAAELAVGIANALVLLDITTIVIGGGISTAYHLFEADLARRIKGSIIPYYAARVRLQKALLGNDAGMLGAVAVFAGRKP